MIPQQTISLQSPIPLSVSFPSFAWRACVFKRISHPSANWLPDAFPDPLNPILRAPSGATVDPALTLRPAPGPEASPPVSRKRGPPYPFFFQVQPLRIPSPGLAGFFYPRPPKLSPARASFSLSLSSLSWASLSLFFFSPHSFLNTLRTLLRAVQSQSSLQSMLHSPKRDNLPFPTPPPGRHLIAPVRPEPLREVATGVAPLRNTPFLATFPQFPLSASYKLPLRPRVCFPSPPTIRTSFHTRDGFLPRNFPIFP